MAGTDKNYLGQLLQKLRKSRLRITEPRIAILEVLVEKHGPYTAEEIYQSFTRKVCDLATIYRCLASMEKAGVIGRCEFGDGATRYELATHQDHHHHLVCKNCKKIEVLDDCELQEINRIAEKRGFVEVAHSLEFFGICPSCTKLKKKA